MRHLEPSTLGSLPPDVVRPAQRPAGVGIVHLGLGAFHRAHQVPYTEDALARAGMAADPWGIAAVSLKTPGARDRLLPQQGLYTIVEKSPGNTKRRVVGAMLEPLFLGEDRRRVQSLMIDPATRIVSLTITEKGYGHDPASGRLVATHPEVAQDLAPGADPALASGALGLIVHALSVRRVSGSRPFTVLCCDNLPHNGATLRGLVLEFARLRDPALAGWIEREGRFPSTMVDRIVPAATPADVAENDAALGVADAAAVTCEPFRQWVIEENFVDGRPPWELAGAEMVADVAPYEAMKLRLLNGSHSALAYLGFLAGHEFIYQVAAEAPFADFMVRLMAEASPTLTMPASVDVEAYRQQLLLRFRNPALAHRTRQVAMDGSQKLPQRLLAPIAENLRAGRPVRHATLAVAAWMRYVTGRGEDGAPFEVADPMAARIATLVAQAGNDPGALAMGLLSLDAIFGSELPRDARFTGPLVEDLGSMLQRGSRATLASCLAGTSA